MKTVIATILVGMAAVMGAGVTTEAADAEQVWVSSRALQVKFDRLYLNHGLEERVYPDCRFVVHLGRDSIYSGCIEESYRGVSVTYPTHGFFDTINTDLLYVWLERAQVDSVTPITVGHVGYLPEASAERETAGSETGNPVQVRRYGSLFEMSLAFEGGEVDATVAYRRQLPGAAGATAEHPAPFIVALIPNPSRTITQDGVLTTSLYYRVDPKRLPLYFNGDAIQPYNRLCLGGDTIERPYPYDPSRGRELLERVRYSSRNVTISLGHPMLAQLAGYFADILSRDRVRTSIVGPNEPADVRLVMVPLDSDVVQSLSHVHQMLADDTVMNGEATDAVTIIGDHLAAARAAEDSVVRARYIRLAERGLRDDIGVFPLFRPTIFYTAGPALVGDVFGELGHAALTRLKRVRLPVGREDCGQ